MNDFILCTDSGCDLKLDVCKKYNIVPLKMKYTINDEVFYDEMTDESAKLLYDKMRAGLIPKTSQINSSDFIDFWTPLLEQKKPILHIAMGSGISGTYANAVIAKDMLLEQHPDAELYVVDSLLASVSYGMLCIDLANMRAEGKSVTECYEWALEKRHLVNTFFTTGELKYLHRGGRVSKTGAVVGTVLNINPILHLSKEGFLQVIEKTRGQKATIKRVHELIGETVIEPENQTLYFCHSDDLERVTAFGEEEVKLHGFKDFKATFIGPTIGAHTGPGLFAAFFYGKPRK